MMKRIYPKRLMLALSMMAVVLAAAVFLWGAEYKCSLYHGQRQKHPRIAIAKLLSERERPAALDRSRLRAPVPEATYFALGFPLFGPPRRAGFERIDRGAWREAAGAGRIRCMVHFFFRPPPALAA